MSMEDAKEDAFEGRWFAHPPMRNALIAGLITGTAFGLVQLGLIPRAAEITIYAGAIVLGGYYWIREGIEELIEEKEVGIEILMTAATLGSIMLGMWDEAAFLVFLYGAAEGVEEYTYARTRHSIRKLLDLVPKQASVLRNGGEVTIPAQELRAGDIFIVRPGESIPTDGIIVRGKSSVNESPVTGEAIPVEKKEGMTVFAGTINQEGVLEARVTTAFEDNTLSRIIHLVEEAQEQKGKAQVFINRFGRIYSPLVLLGALLLMIIPTLLGLSFSHWAARAVVLLVAAAPCALVMSTPVATAAGIGKAGRTGVLIKGGAYLEDLGKIKAVAFDKTGTLTKGKPVVTDIVGLDGSANDVLTFAYSVDRFSSHPLAKAIVEKAEELDIKSLKSDDFKAVAGYGAKARVGEEMIHVGNPEIFKQSGHKLDLIPQIEVFRNAGKTVVFIGNKETIFGIIAIRDQARSNAKSVIEQLQHMGIRTVMLTGDNEVTAKAIAEELGIDEMRANLRPEDKVGAVRALEQKYGAIAMVGDGINDAPALATATVGMAMGTAGTDAAIEAADIALMADDLAKVPHAIGLGSKARRISLQNIVFSLFILAVLVPSALSGIMSVAIAVLLHEASELLAVANGLRMAGRAHE